MAGAPGFEPGIAGPKPAALPLGYAPRIGRWSIGASHPGSAAVEQEDDERDRPRRARARRSRARSGRARARARARPRAARRRRSRSPRARPVPMAAANADVERERERPRARARVHQGMASKSDEDALDERDPRAQVPAARSRASVPRRPCPCSIGVVEPSTTNNVAAQPYQVGTVSQVRPAAPSGAPRGHGGAPVVEEAVHRGAGAGDVGAEGAEAEQLVGERRAREVVRGQGGEVARSPHALERALERAAPLVPALGAAALVEAPVDAGRRLLDGAVRKQEERPSSPAAARAARARSRRRAPSCGPVAEEERAHPRRARSERVQRSGGERLRQASRSRAGARWRRRSCRRRGRPRRECASSGSRARRGSTPAAAASCSSARADERVAVEAL